MHGFERLWGCRGCDSQIGCAWGGLERKIGAGLTHTDALKQGSRERTRRGGPDALKPGRPAEAVGGWVSSGCDKALKSRGE